MPGDDLEKLRKKIDRIDQDIQRLLNERAGCAQSVAEVKLKEFQQQSKSSGGGSGDAPVFYRPEREAQVLRGVMERNTGPLDAAEVAHIFREIMSACLALEQPVQAAFLGPSGTFTQAAALKHFGHAVITRPQSTIGEVFTAVERGECAYGVVPVENSTEGMVTHTLDNLLNSPLKICGEVELPICLHLLTQAGETRESVKVIYAHQQALAQSRNWLETHYPDVAIEAVSSNGEAARLAAEKAGVAAVAGELARENYGLATLAENIHDLSSNTTRFLVIAHDEVPPSGKDKTSIVVSTRNVPGALYKLLQPLQEAGISLTRIETRPSRTENWAYVFFMEFEGHHQDEAINQVIDTIVEQSFFVKVLGSYPVAVI